MLLLGSRRPNIINHRLQVEWVISVISLCQVYKVAVVLRLPHEQRDHDLQFSGLISTLTFELLLSFRQHIVENTTFSYLHHIDLRL